MSDHARCQQLAALIEPDPTLVDDGHARPSSYADGIWYVWPVRTSGVAVDTGQTDEERFEYRVDYGVDRRGEGEDRDPEVSAAIDAAADQLWAAVRANRALTGYWEWIAVVEIDWQANLGIDVRGFFARVSGYQIVP